MENIKVELIFPHNSEKAQADIKLPYDELMLILNCGDVYLPEFKDETEPNPFYKIEQAIRYYDHEDYENRSVTLMLEYPHNHSHY